MQGYGRSLGRVLIVNVGYNESSDGYRQGIDRIMRAALAQGAAGVVWVTLRETRGIYHPTNVVIERATKRWPQLLIADWNAFSSGKPWFGDDGLHLTADGRDGARQIPAAVRLEGRSGAREPTEPSHHPGGSVSIR